MSWAAHNPEKYDEIMRNGVRQWLWGYLPDERQNDEAFQADLDYMLTELQYDFKDGGNKIFDALANQATTEICDAERSYFESFIP